MCAAAIFHASLPALKIAGGIAEGMILETAVDRFVLVPTSWNHEHFCCKESSSTG